MDTYTPGTGVIFLFNLMVGTGALTMPSAFGNAGWILSTVAIFLLCFMSFLSLTFVIESMSIGNAVQKMRHPHRSRMDSEDDTFGDDVAASESRRLLESENESEEELTPIGIVDKSVSHHRKRIKSLTSTGGSTEVPESPFDEENPFDINRQTELGSLAQTFLPSYFVVFFYLCMIVYLYGDLAIYGAAIAKSLRDVTCSSHPINGSIITQDCFNEGKSNLSRHQVYQLYILGVALTLGPLAFFNVSKTKLLQVCTTFARWMSFITMIALALISLFKGKGEGKPIQANVSALPNLFGVSVYSFMCHHSLPALITPIRPKRHLYRYILADYLVILVFYLLLCFTGVFTFSHLEDIYTLNFQESTGGPIAHIKFLEWFLPLFPVFTLSASFPIISITLTNNLKTLLLDPLTRVVLRCRHPQIMNEDINGIILQRQERIRFLLGRIFFPILATLPSLVLATCTENLKNLVGIVGSYAGTMVQYVIPSLILLYARSRIPPSDGCTLNLLETNVKRALSSPFSSPLWVWFTFLWAALIIIFVTIDNVTKLL